MNRIIGACARALVAAFAVLSVSQVSSGAAQTPRPARPVPQFSRREQAFPPMATMRVLLADLDSDGDLDAVFSNFGDRSRIFLNDGRGLFRESTQAFPLGHGASVGDVDRDGDQDLVFAANGPAPPGYGQQAAEAYLNDGRGVFERTGRDIGSRHILSYPVTLVDVDGDADLDVAVEYRDGRDSVYLNDGRGSFGTRGLPVPHAPLFCDVNRDGVVDVVTRETGVGFAVYLNDRRGRFARFSESPRPALGMSEAFFSDCADVDRDGDNDVIYLDAAAAPSPAGILLNDGTGRLTDSGQRLASVASGRIATGDVNNDGATDIVFSSQNAPAQVWLNDGSGRFFDSGIRLADRLETMGLAIADVNGDGTRDVLLGDYRRGSAELWINRPRGR